MEPSNATKVAKVKAGRGGVVPPADKQFGQPNGNPRHNGAWRKEDTPRYKLEQMFKLDQDAIVKIANDKDAPLFERRIARSLLKENEFKTTEAMINQVYGQPKTKQEIELNGEIAGISITVKDYEKNDDKK